VTSERALLRMSEVAERLGVSRSTAYELAASGRLPGVMRVSQSLRVNARRLDEWIEAESAPKTAAVGRP
jgi:excisionase family DNA binding protein